MTNRYDLIKIQEKLQKKLTPDRYQHTLGVMYTCAALAMCHGCNLERAMVAGLLHDCAKCIPNDKKISICEKNNIAITEAERKNPSLLHAKAGVFLAKSKYDIEDEDILDAIRYHTTGNVDMTLLQKITYLADYIEPWRNKATNLHFRILTRHCIWYFMIHFSILKQSMPKSIRQHSRHMNFTDNCRKKNRIE